MIIYKTFRDKWEYPTPINELSIFHGADEQAGKFLAAYEDFDTYLLREHVTMCGYYAEDTGSSENIVTITLVLDLPVGKVRYAKEYRS